MHSIPTVLRSSKSWSNSTQRSEYSKYSNSWVGLTVGIDKLNNNCSNNTCNERFSNTNLPKNCYKSSNLIRPEKYKINNEHLFLNSFFISGNNASRQNIINPKSVQTNIRTTLPQNAFPIKDQVYLKPCSNELINGFGVIEVEGVQAYQNIPHMFNKEFVVGLNNFNKKISSQNSGYPQLVPISRNNSFRATSFIENKKPNFNYTKSISGFIPENSKFVSERYRSNNIRSFKHISCTQEIGYNSNNLPKSQLSMNYSLNQENSSKFLNNKPANSKIPNFLASKFSIRNFSKAPINPVINLESDGSGIDVNIKDIKILSLLGIGSTSLVYSGFWRGTEVAVKILGNYPKNMESNYDLNLSQSVINSLEMIQKDSQRYLEFKNEIRIMRLLRHPNIVQYMGCNINSNPAFLICEFCSGGTLFSLLHGVSKKCLNSNDVSFSGPSIDLSLFQRIKILQDIARGIYFLHSANPPIIHRDIKSLNIFLSLPIKSKADIPIAKVGDFGLCQQSFLNKGFANKSGNLVGTYQWMAPEVLTNQTYNEYIDVYSFGMIMYEVFSNKTPFFELGVDVNPEVLADEIIRGIRPTLKYIVSDAPLEIKNIMVRCWDPSPIKRGTMLIIINELQHLMENLINSQL